MAYKSIKRGGGDVAKVMHKNVIIWEDNAWKEILKNASAALYITMPDGSKNYGTEIVRSKSLPKNLPSSVTGYDVVVTWEQRGPFSSSTGGRDYKYTANITLNGTDKYIKKYFTINLRGIG